MKTGQTSDAPSCAATDKPLDQTTTAQRKLSRRGRVGRRQILRGAGSSLLLAPVLPHLGGQESAHAQQQTIPQRLVVFVTQGTHVPTWTLNGSTPTNLVFNEMNEPLSVVKDKLVVVEGLGGRHAAKGHGSKHGLTGRGNSSYFKFTPTRSIDQVVVDLLQDQGVQTPIASLLLGADINQQRSVFFRDTRLPVLDSPAQAFNVAFGGVPAPGSGESPADILARNQSMLDVLTEDLAELSARLGEVERRKLDIHLSSIRQMEARLQAAASGPSANCDAGAAPVVSSDPVTNAKLQMELARQTLACDVTRVASVMWGTDNQFIIDLPELGILDDQHSLQHVERKFEMLVLFERYLAEQFALFVQSLATTPGPNGGMLLDDTLVVWARHMGDAVSHTSDDQRFVFAGAGLNTAAGGRYIRADGQEYERGLHTIAAAFGETDFTDIGEPDAVGEAKTPLEDALA